METNKIHASFLFALVILLIFAGCKSYRPTLFEALSSPAEIRDVGNPFVGVWEMNYPYNRNARLIYIFTDDKRWKSYYVYGGEIVTSPSNVTGTYTYRGPRLYMTKGFGGIFDGMVFSPVTTIYIVRLDGDELKFGPNDNNPLRRLSADWQSYEVNPGTTAKLQ